MKFSHILPMVALELGAITPIRAEEVSDSNKSLVESYVLENGKKVTMITVTEINKGNTQCEPGADSEDCRISRARNYHLNNIADSDAPGVCPRGFSRCFDAMAGDYSIKKSSRANGLLAYSLGEVVDLSLNNLRACVDQTIPAYSAPAVESLTESKFYSGDEMESAPMHYCVLESAASLEFCTEVFAAQYNLPVQKNPWFNDCVGEIDVAFERCVSIPR